MKLTTIAIVFLCTRFSLCTVHQSTLFERISVDPDPYDDLQFTLSNVAKTSESLKIRFNVQESAARADKAKKLSESRPFSDYSTYDSVRYEYAQKVFLTALKLNDHCVTVNYTTVDSDGVLAATIDTLNLRLYGGAEHMDLKWPYDKMTYKLTPYVTQQDGFQAVLEPYWLTSTGFFIYVDQRVPLFFELSAKERILRLLAFGRTPPYWKPWDHTFLNFTICNFGDARAAHRHAVHHYLGKPVDIPDTNRVREPIWSTWVLYGEEIDADLVRTYAREISQHGYRGQIQIDDDWEECYGSLSPNANLFENFPALVGEIQSFGFRVAVWTHPFVNADCMPEDVSDEFFVKNMQGERETGWWRGEASYIDFTSPKASQWYRDRLLALAKEHHLDGFKFDGGESSFVPVIANFCRTDSFHPETIVQSYVKLIASLKQPSNAHTRVARGTQKYPVFVTMMDRDTRWTGPLALSTLIPQLLQLNILGYSFVLPDMVGGNFLSGEKNAKGSKPELFVRWLQANVFMPSIQFSVPPWYFGKQATDLAKKFVDLHAKYADEIIGLMRRNVEHGDPVNPPIWWIAPDDQEALECDSEYLLGENVLVAPVLTEGATERDIYLPRGLWRDENRPRREPLRGPLWIRNYPANLSVLPYFTRISAGDDVATNVKLKSEKTLKDMVMLPEIATLIRSSNTRFIWFILPALVISYFIATRGLRMRKYFFGMFRSGT